MVRNRPSLLHPAWLFGALVLTAGLSCRTSKPAPQPPPPRPAPEGLAALMPEAPPPLGREDPERAVGPALRDFLGEPGPALLACGATEAARGRFPSPEGRALVVLLVAFADPDGAACAFDLDRAGEPAGIRGVDPPALADERPLGPERVRMVVRKGARLAWLYAPAEGPGHAHAEILAARVAAALPDDGEGLLGGLSPEAYREPGTVRVVSRGAVKGLGGLAVMSRHTCQDGTVVDVHVLRLADEPAAVATVGAVQDAAMESFKTVSPFRLGDAAVLSLFDAETNRETLVIRRGRMVAGIGELTSRRACATLIEALAAVADPRPDVVDAGLADAGVVGDAGAPENDASPPDAAPQGADGGADASRG